MNKTCRNCKHRERWALNEKSSKVVQCCNLQPSIGKGFAPKVDVDLWVDARGKHKGGMSIGEEYYETDPWSKKEDAINELKDIVKALKGK